MKGTRKRVFPGAIAAGRLQLVMEITGIFELCRLLPEIPASIRSFSL